MAVLCRCARVSSSWRDAVQHDALWMPIFHASFSNERLAAVGRIEAPQPIPEVGEGWRGSGGLWRRRYDAAHCDAMEFGISAAELVQQRWSFRFKHDMSLSFAVSYVHRECASAHHAAATKMAI